MTLKGYQEYQRREFCKEKKCPVQLNLDSRSPDSREYEKIREICKSKCKYTAYQFHHWLIEKGYLILKSKKNRE